MSNSYNIAKQGDSLKALERRRNLRFLRWLPTFLWLISVAFFLLYYSEHWKTSGDFVDGWAIFLGTVFPVALLVFRSMKTKLQDRYNSDVLSQLVRQSGLGYSKSGRLAGKHLVKAGLYYGPFSRIKYEHQVSGDYQGTNFAFATFKVIRISKVKIAGAGMGGYVDLHTDFGLSNREYSGIRYSIVRAQNVPGHVVIVPLLQDVKDAWDEKVVKNLLSIQKSTEFEYFQSYDHEFDLRFMVFTTNTRSAEALLTEDMKLKLLQTLDDFDVSTSFAFRGKHLYIHATKRESMFQINKSVPFDDEMVEKHIAELDDHLKLVKRFTTATEKHKPRTLNVHSSTH
jgi:hypothetical protein